MTSPQTEPKRPRRKWKGLLIALLAFLLAICVAVGAYAWLYFRGRQSMTGGGDRISAPSELVEQIEEDVVLYNGVKYRYNENVTAVLVLGIDKEDIQEEATYGQNGQADTLFLAVLDTKSGNMNILPISRDSMVDVDTYTADGSYAGVEKTQLCLAYGYASNGEEGCRNVMRSVSRLLYGVPINNYVAIDLEGVKAVTDVVGGVPLTASENIYDDWNRLTFAKGQKLTLKGEDALAYIRYRGSDAEGNSRRMQRQKQFFTAFLSRTGSQLKKNIGKLPDYYNAAAPYVVTNINLSQATYLATCALSGGGWSNPIYLSIEGKAIKEGKHAEFYPDTASVYEAVLAAFYTPVEP